MTVLRALPRVLALSALALGGLLAAASGVAATTTTIECGQFTAYAPPDPVGPADGSLTLAALPAWPINADAVVSASVAANLPSILNNSPTCLAMDLDDAGRVAALDFASHGTISGAVVRDTGLNAFRFADRLTLPLDFAASMPGLEAIFSMSADAGTDLSVAFEVDAATGRITGFTGTAIACGAGALQPNGDVRVGAATISARFLDAGDLATLQGAGTAAICASVETLGVIDPGDGNLTTTTTVKLTVPPVAPVPTPAPTSRAPALTPPPTSTETPAVPGGEGDDITLLPFLSAGCSLGASMILLRRRRLPR